MMNGIKTWLAVGCLGPAVLTGCLGGPQAVGAPGSNGVGGTPAPPVITVGHSAACSALLADDPAVVKSWKVLEADGGSVDEAGRYHAPLHPGVFTLQAERQDGSHGVASRRIAVVPLPEGVIVTQPNLPPGAANQTATVSPNPAFHYAWTISGGTITGGKFSSSVKFETGTGPSVILKCRVSNAAGESIILSRVIAK